MLPLRRAFAVSLFFTICFASFVVARSTFALTACQCSCIDTSDMTRVLTTAPAQGQSFMQKCQADGKCTGGSVLTNAYDFVSTQGVHQTACECTLPQVSTNLVAQAPADTTCKASCEASCRTQDLAVNPNISPIAVQTPCITDNDCRTGVFAKFKGVTCMVEGSGTTAVRACNIPVTGDIGKENANIECANYAGPGMNGATCDFVAAGNVPSSYLITRPYIYTGRGGNGYQQRVYSGTSYPFAENLWTALDTDGGITNTPGICYLYGSQQADYSSMDVTKTLVQGANGSKRYVCMKRKISQCGTVNIPKSSYTPIVKSSFRYSCMPKSSVDITQQTSNCLSPTGSYQSDDGKTTVPGSDLCSTPNQLCCALHCTLDSECGSFRICSDGTCVAKTQCNDNDSTWKCRVASAAEKANPNTCLQSLIKPLCQSSGMSCCAPVNPAAVGSCAADMQNNADFKSRFGTDGWTGFSCLSNSDLNKMGQALISDWKDGGSCIMSDVASNAGEAKSAARCGLTKRCCQVSAVAPDTQAKLAARPAIGTTGCSKDLTFANSCINLATTLGYDSRGLAQSTTQSSQQFDSMYAYGQAVIATGACQATNVSPDNPFNTWECASNASSNGVCCYSGLRQCDPNQSTSCSTGEVCHPQLGVCIPSTLMSKQVNSEKCADRASAAGDTSVEFISASNGVSPGDLTCQIVNANDSQVGSKCLLQGCTTPDGQSLSDGQAYRCCVAGTGQSPAASAATTGLGQSQTGGSVPKAPSTIGLSSCISSGQCQLDDILYSAANFANFLFKISGAIFLAIFVYAGFLYMTAFSSDRGKKALGMIKQSSIGLVLLFAAYILVNFIQSSFISSATQTVADKCGSTPETQNMTCQFLPVDANDAKGISDIVQSRSCVRSLCGGPKNRVCCPFGASNTQ